MEVVSLFLCFFFGGVNVDWYLLLVMSGWWMILVLNCLCKLKFIGEWFIVLFDFLIFVFFYFLWGIWIYDIIEV